MRNRLVAAFVGLTLAVVALYAVPRALSVAGLVEDHQQQLLALSADTTAERAQAALDDGEPVTTAVLARSLAPGQSARYVAADGTVTTYPPGTRVGSDDLTVTRTLTGGGEVTLWLDGAVVDRETRDALRPLLVLGLLLVPVAALGGIWLARRLGRPFDELAATARRMGTGDLTSDVPHYRIPEAEAVGRALHESAERLDTLIRRERDVALHASHELRTPITALRLTLEDLALWPQTSPEVAEELHRIVAEVDRFALAVTQILDEARSGRLAEAEDFDLGDVLGDAVSRWQPVAAAVGLRLAADPSSARARLPRGAVTQTLDLVLQHACETASGTVRASCSDRGSYLAAEVSFARRHADWHGAPAAVGIREASELAAALGGHLIEEPATDEDSDVVLVLLLPSAEAAQTVA
jgi:signal transduction histidine kinase